MKKCIATVAMFIAITSFSYGEDRVEVLNEKDVNYVSLNIITKNLDGEVFEEEGKIGFRFNDEEVLISKNQSFFLSKGKYRPLNIENVDGFNVPCDTNPIFKDDQVYVPVSMLNDNYILRCYVENNNFIIGEKEEVKVPVGPVRPTRPEVTPPPVITPPPITPPVKPPVNPPVDPPTPPVEPEKPKPEPEPEPPTPPVDPEPPKPDPDPDPEPPTPPVDPEPPKPDPDPEPEPPTPPVDPEPPTPPVNPEPPTPDPTPEPSTPPVDPETSIPELTQQ